MVLEVTPFPPKNGLQRLFNALHRLSDLFSIGYSDHFNTTRYPEHRWWLRCKETFDVDDFSDGFPGLLSAGPR